MFDGINTLQGLWVFAIFVGKRNVTNLILVSLGLRESKRSKAKSKPANMQVNFKILHLNVILYHYKRIISQFLFY